MNPKLFQKFLKQGTSFFTFMPEMIQKLGIWQGGCANFCLEQATIVQVQGSRFSLRVFAEKRAHCLARA